MDSFVSSEKMPDSNHLDEDQLKCLKDQGFTTGLAISLWRNSKECFPLRIWIVDNSGSMNAADGKRLVETKRRDNVKLVPCTRWAELKECVSYHANMAALLEAPTRFILLNDPGDGYPQEFGVAVAGDIDEETQLLQDRMSAVSPRGVTPLVKHLEDIYETVSAMEPSLRQSGQRVAVVIATDGLPTDSGGIHSPAVSLALERSLERLGSLPVWIVIRLCTNDDNVIQYYDKLDSKLELSLEVLDDFCDEAKEVYQHNRWLNYALPLHRCRESGFQNRLFDLIDERKLMMEEMADFMRLLLHIPDDLDPAGDWDEFYKHVANELKKEEDQWNPNRGISGRMSPWIDLDALAREYGDNKADAASGGIVILFLVILVAILVQILKEAA